MNVRVVTGSRYGTSSSSQREELRRFVSGADLLILGDASGVDAEALDLAIILGISYQTFTAFWDLLGLSAGPTRNETMAAAAHVYAKRNHAVIGGAFPGNGNSTGTYNCISALKKLDIPVEVYR